MELVCIIFAALYTLLPAVMPWQYLAANFLHATVKIICCSSGNSYSMTAPCKYYGVVAMVAGAILLAMQEVNAQQ